MTEGERQDSDSRALGAAEDEGATTPDPQAAGRPTTRRGRAGRAWLGALIVGAMASVVTSGISSHLNAQGGDAPERLPDGTFVGFPMGIGIFLCVGLIAARRYWLGFAVGPVLGFATGGLFMGLSFLGPMGPLIVPVFAVLWGFSSWALQITVAVSVAVGFLLTLYKGGGGGGKVPVVAAAPAGDNPTP